MRCWKCKNRLIDENKKVGFRAECLRCGADLHVCMNCRHHAPGKANECAIPGTDLIRDREKANFCDEFQPKKDLESDASHSSSDALKKARRLLGLDDPPEKSL